ncbi:hypothetical protein EXIGLDRAFT_612228, partial [Exidia glandulosa HHB12029]
NRFTTRRKYAWAPIGERARRHDYFVRGQRYSVLPALSLDGILHAFVQDHSYTSDEFLHFIDQLLLRMNPYPQKNSVILLDNASIHKSRELEDLIHARCVELAVRARLLSTDFRNQRHAPSLSPGILAGFESHRGVFLGNEVMDSQASEPLLGCAGR